MKDVRLHSLNALCGHVVHWFGLLSVLLILNNTRGNEAQVLSVDKVLTNSTVDLTGSVDLSSALNEMHDWIFTNRPNSRVVSVSPFRISSAGSKRTLIMVKHPNGVNEYISFIVATKSFTRIKSTLIWDAFIAGLEAPKRSAFFLSHMESFHQLLRRSSIDEVIPYMVGQLTNETRLSISLLDPTNNTPRPAQAKDMAAQFLLLNVQEKTSANPILPESLERTALGTVRLVKAPSGLSVRVNVWWQSRGKTLLEHEQLEWTKGVD